MAADVLWPWRERVPLNHSDFLILNHCLPSTRGDRDCSYDGILKAVVGSDRDGILRLERSGALLADAIADPLYKDIQLWVRHDWYLSLLALMESANDGGTRPVSSRIKTRDDYTDNPGVLRDRRTTRAFPPQRAVQPLCGCVWAARLSGRRHTSWA